MADIKINRQLIISDLDKARFDPAGQHRKILERVAGAVRGEQVLVDPSNPYMLLMEAAVSTAAYTLIQAEVLTRKQYPSLAMTEEDLYLFMTDRDYADRFAQPAMVPISLMFSVEEIKQYAVDTGSGGVRKIVIPKDTALSAGGNTFTMEFPLEFRVLGTGGITVAWGELDNVPLHTIGNNIIDWQPADLDQVQMLLIRIPVYQFAITSNTGYLNAAVVYNESFAYSDKFYYCRCYMKRTDGGWKEMRITHTDQVFDPTVPTALLRVFNGRVYVKIPQIYYTNKLVEGTLRVDIYTTKAENNVVMTGYSPSDWSAQWVDLDDTEDNVYSAPMQYLHSSKVFSDGVTSGARDALSFEDLRTRVMDHNVGEINIPITNVHKDRRLSDQGYDAVTDIDDITNRMIWGTKALPTPLDNSTVTPAGCGIDRITVRMSELVGLYGVSDNGPRMTLHPSLLYKNEAGAPEIVSKSELDYLYSLKPDGMARKVTDANYLYHQWHYVLDSSDNTFSSAAYYLDAPVINTRQFVAENDTTGIELATGKLALVVVDGGYKLTLVTNSGETYQKLDDDKVYVQLAYTPTGEQSMAYLNGTLVGRTPDGERVWEFLLGTTYDIDRNDSLYLNTFSMFGDEARQHPIPLATNFEIIYIVADYTTVGMRESDIDLAKNKQMLPNKTIGLLQERANITLGYALKGLWSGSRTVATAQDYETYTVDEPLRYEKAEYATDDQDQVIFELVDGQYRAKVLHQAGEIQKNPDGSTRWKGQVGQYKRDVNGNLVVKGGRELARQIDLFFLDGSYYFATNQGNVDYKTYISTTVKGWVLDQIGDLQKVVLEKTNLYFYPQSTISSVSCTVGEGVDVVLEAPQSFKVVLSLTELGYKNLILRGSLKSMVIGVIAEILKQVSPSTKDMVSAIRTGGGDELMGIEVTGLGGAKNYSVVSMKDDSGRLAIAKKLVALPDGFFGIEEDVDVQFVRHLPSRVLKS